MGSQSLELVNDLVKFKVFKEVVDEAHRLLIPYGYSVHELFYNSDENTFKSIMNVTVTIAIVQVLQYQSNHYICYTPNTKVFKF